MDLFNVILLVTLVGLATCWVLLSSICALTMAIRTLKAFAGLKSETSKSTRQPLITHGIRADMLAKDRAAALAALEERERAHALASSRAAHESIH